MVGWGAVQTIALRWHPQSEETTGTHPSPGTCKKHRTATRKDTSHGSNTEIQHRMGGEGQIPQHGPTPCLPPPAMADAAGGVLQGILFSPRDPTAAWGHERCSPHRSGSSSIARASPLFPYLSLAFPTLLAFGCLALPAPPLPIPCLALCTPPFPCPACPSLALPCPSYPSLACLLLCLALDFLSFSFSFPALPCLPLLSTPPRASGAAAEKPPASTYEPGVPRSLGHCAAASGLPGEHPCPRSFPGCLRSAPAFKTPSQGSPRRCRRWRRGQCAHPCVCHRPARPSPEHPRCPEQQGALQRS